MTTASTIAGILAILLAGGMAGLYFAFSNAVMGGLAQAGPLAALRAMQGINRVILNPLFMLFFFALPIPAFVASWLSWSGPSAQAARWFLASALVSLAGNLVVTMVVNVPLNQLLDRAAPQTDGEAEGPWRAYAGPWTRWNHVRAVACFVALGLAGMGLATAA